MTLFSYLWLLSVGVAQENRPREIRNNIPLDAIVLSNPFILADQKTSMYYMTGTGGMLWESKDLKYVRYLNKSND